MKKVTTAGLDVSAIMGTRKMQVWVPFSEQMKVQLNYVSRDEFIDLLAQATETSWDRKHQKVEDFDAVKFSLLLGKAAVASWDGPVADGAAVPCTPENIEKFMTHWLDFAKFVSDSCTDLERLVAAEKGEIKKK